MLNKKTIPKKLKLNVAHSMMGSKLKSKSKLTQDDLFDLFEWRVRDPLDLYRSKNAHA